MTTRYLDFNTFIEKYLPFLFDPIDIAGTKDVFKL